MKILIATTIVPFIEGGGRMIATDLVSVLAERGHTVDIVRIPFVSRWNDMLDQMLAVRLFDLSEESDLLITIRTPSYLLRHPNKIAWFIHHHRGAYDLWGTAYQDIPNTEEGLRTRQAFIDADNISLREAKKIFTNSKIVSQRLKDHNDLDSEVLYPPLLDWRRFHPGNSTDYIFYPSRITKHKRQDLAIEAMKYVKSDVRLVVAGNPDAPEQLEFVERTIQENQLSERVQLLGRWISEDEKADLFSKCLGCVYIPFQEDSYGYVSLESFHSEKPVITCSDSGGTLEIVEDGVNGFVVPPEPKALAEAFDRLRLDPTQAARMGRTGPEKIRQLNISWDHVVKSFTQ
ncbi:MAG TPA: glycosyltransferase family 4 protein [Terriglobales bacterium]|nr:glycosyltransferase family 4 protein [Terriglobales bacterium]